MRACIMYTWKIFDEILKEIVKLEKNVNVLKIDFLTVIAFYSEKADDPGP